RKRQRAACIRRRGSRLHRACGPLAVIGRWRFLKSDMPRHHDRNEPLRIVCCDDVAYLAVTLASPAIIGR
ncbi:hypothetical protein, partial [Xanthomonas graminis]|uniref:hypothetical protein n=1 Tax=Xanthomonas graminis TaxID=3390026 RepID=UPI001C8F98E3